MRIFLFLFLLFLTCISSSVNACMEMVEKKEARFKEYDADKNGFVDENEWNKIHNDGLFGKYLEAKDKNGDGVFSKEEFLTINFVKCL